LLFYGNLQYQSSFLTLPHPRLHQRRFVLVPLAELDPHLVHPGINQTIQELLEHTDDTSMVKRWNPYSSRESGVESREKEGRIRED
jgi:2-amino-4-hydroxy-6-hydroxymethyldihydropteridine diphosphokinase